MKIKTLVVDDERLNRDLISKLISKTNNNFEIVGLAENIDEAYEMIHIHKPDLICLDIKMPGGNGFELLKRFEKPNFEVVFVTGFDEYAIQAFEFNALDYILKPIDTDKLKNTLEKVFHRISNSKRDIVDLKEILDVYDIDYSKIVKIPIHHNDKVVLLDVFKTISIQAYEGYTVFKTIDHEEFLSSKQFSSFEFIFDSYSNFCKINKSVYINIDFIKSYTKSYVCEVTLSNNSVFEVSRRKKTEILSLLDLRV